MIEVLTWTKDAWSDYFYWHQHDVSTRNRINELIQDAATTPLSGIGKPVSLHASLAGLWSRKIDMTNRLIYAVDNNTLTIISCRYHLKMTMVLPSS